MFGDVLYDQEHTGFPVVRDDVEATFIHQWLTLSIGKSIGLAPTGAEGFPVPDDGVGKQLRS